MEAGVKAFDSMIKEIMYFTDYAGVSMEMYSSILSELEFEESLGWDSVDERAEVMADIAYTHGVTTGTVAAIYYRGVLG